jgi:hypothetical protein
MRKIFPLIASLLLFSVALTLLILSMRAVMGVGGSCAEGGAYVIQQHCPQGSAYFAPLSIFLMLGSAVWYFAARRRFGQGPHWGYFFWSALFVSLGWNFIQLGVFPDGTFHADPVGLLCGGMFLVMGAGPLFVPRLQTGEDTPRLSENLVGKNPVSTGMIIAHIVSVALGIIAAVQLFARS